MPIIYLGLKLPASSIDLPATSIRISEVQRATVLLVADVAYLIFQPVRFAMRKLLLDCRWSLTPPFHPYHSTIFIEKWRYILCGTVCYWLFLPIPPLSRGTVLFAVRTFLSPENRNSDEPACVEVKVVKYYTSMVS